MYRRWGSGVTSNSEARKRRQELWWCEKQVAGGPCNLTVDHEGRCQPVPEWARVHVDRVHEREERDRERTREVVRDALAAVYSGAEMVEADCLLDQLADRGASVSVVGP